MTVHSNLSSPPADLDATWSDNVFDNLFFLWDYPGVGRVIFQLFPSDEACLDASKDTTSIWSVVDETGGVHLVAAENRAIAIQGLRSATGLAAQSIEPSGLPMPRQILAEMGIECED